MGEGTKTQPFALVLLLWAFSFILALKWGIAPGLDLQMVTELRLPRAVLAGAIGAGLAVSGAVLQALFTNPLAEPYTIGVSSGAALGSVVGSFFLGAQWVFGGVALPAFIGALIFAGVLYGISRKSSGGSATLLLAGVMMQFFGSSLVALWMAFADPNGIQGSLLWLMGDLSRARLMGSLWVLFVVVAAIFSLWALSRDLDALLTGEEGALALGVDLKAIRRKVILIVSMLIAVCVSSAGMIGFVGLVIPHLVRRQTGSLHRGLIPLCALWGAFALTIADIGSRMIARPYELPIGVVTALMGAPVFFWILLRQQTRAG